MHVLIAAWTPKPAWLALTEAERADYAATAKAGVAALEEQGIRALGWGWLDEASRGIDRAAFAVWDCGSEAGLAVFRAAVVDAGWDEYFDQIDFGGELGSPDSVMARHVALA